MSRLGRYNLTRYNTPGGSQQIAAALDGYATLTAAFSVGVQVLPLVKFAAALTADARLRWGYAYTGSQETALTASMKLQRLWAPNFTAPAELDADLNWSLVIRPQPVTDEAELGAEAALAADIYRVMSLAEELTAQMVLSPVICPRAEDYSALDAVFSLESQSEVVMTFANITLARGARLVIDTENCTAVLVDSSGVTNVIRYYAGDWPWISRLLRGFEVTALTSGDLDVRIMYRERYL